MSNTVDLVRYRNDGDDFHILWTARRAMRLLDSSSGLVAVSIEGTSEREPTVEEGLLVIDTTEYYGAEKPEEADQIAYCQLKYSTTSPLEPWTVSGLEHTLKGFADRFKTLRQKHGTNLVSSRFRFRFVSNRPIDADILALFNPAPNPQTTPSGSKSKKSKSEQTLEKLHRACGLDAQDFQEFAPLVDLWGDQKSRYEQTIGLESDIASYSAVMDDSATARMRRMVSARVLSDSKDNNTLRRDNLFAELGVHDRWPLETESPFEPVEQPIPREQEAAIVQAILTANQPVIIEAEGGVGKSVLAQRLPNLLPEGSETVVFDGFANGGYRSSRDGRHKHERGLLKIANTLAARGLCNVLLRVDGAGPDDYLRAFDRRLRQAALTVKTRSPGAIVLIVLDAADNSVMAALEKQEHAFAPDLLQEPPPEACRIVALARPYRVDSHLRPRRQALRIRLEPFSLAETAAHLRQKFPEADEQAVEAFHRYTDQNPRVQGNALASADSLGALLGRLGPVIRTVDELIAGQLQEALEKALGKLIDEQATSPDEFKPLCGALVALPPWVPLDVLCQAVQLPEAAVKSFITDFGAGRYILLHDNATQFRDEPVETWFREIFANSQDFSSLADRLQSLALTNGYVAAAMPSLLLQAGRYDELVTLALHGGNLDCGDPVEQRDVVLRRVQYALKAAVAKERWEDAAKLLLRVGEEVAANSRQSRFLMENADLVSDLAGADTVFNFVFLKSVKELHGLTYAHCAAMLAVDPKNRTAAKDFLNLAEAWLFNEWVKETSDNRQKIHNEDIAAFALVYYKLWGASETVEYFSGWQPKTVAFEAGRILCSRLIDRNESEAVEELFCAAGQNLYLRLAASLELSFVSKHPPPEEMAVIFEVFDDDAIAAELNGSNSYIELNYAITNFSETACRLGLPKSEVMALLHRYRPENSRLIRYYDDRIFQRKALFQTTVLLASLQRQVVNLDDLTPESLRKDLAKKQGEDSSEVRFFKENYGALLPWYVLRAKAIVDGIQECDWPTLLASTLKEAQTGRFIYGRDSDWLHTINEIGQLWLETLVLSGLADCQKVREVECWLAKQKVTIFIQTWVGLARICAHHPLLQANALGFAMRAKDLIASSRHDEASHTAESFASLARAVFPIEGEAAEYFQLGMDFLSRRLGDDLYDQLMSLVKLAEQASSTNTHHPELAYRLARTAELFCAYNDHKFPWPDVACAIASLCPNSSFAIASRWHDRDLVWLGESLPLLARTLLEKNHLAPTLAASLHVFPGYWRLSDDNIARLFFKPENSQKQKQLILEMLLQDEEFGNSKREQSSIDVLFKMARAYGLHNTRLEELNNFASSQPQQEEEQESEIKLSCRQPEKEEPAIDWPAILVNDLETAEGISKATQLFVGTEDNYWRLNWREFHQRMRQALTQPRQWPAHILALSQNSEVQTENILDALEAAADDWQNSMQVKNAIKQAIQELIRKNPYGLAYHRWGSPRELKKCLQLSGLSHGELLKQLLNAIAERIESISDKTAFYLTEEVAKTLLNPTQTLQVLTFALARLELVMDNEDGDGPWREELMPPSSLPESVAGFLYAMLAAPEPETRWQAAHAVHRLCQLEEAGIIKALLNLLKCDKLPAFTDGRLPFYAWHARLYLFIALSRAALDSPEILRPHLDVFLRHAFEGAPHVLIRHFAAVIVLQLEKINPGLCEAETLEKLKRINTSPYPPEPRPKNAIVGWNMGSREGRYSFDHDFDRYWLGDLAETFNLSHSEIAQRAECWILDRWRIQAKGRSADDPRRYRSTSTYIRHFSYPEIDSYGFYLSYHSMFCTAGDLLKDKPTSSEGYWWDGKAWEGWLHRHFLTKNDGYWLADRRDPRPLERRFWQIDKLDYQRREEWRWLILPRDFDQVLGLSDLRTDSLVVWGNWNITQDSFYETIRVSSALVSNKTSLALLRALQTATNNHDDYIPPENDRRETAEPGFKISGWVFDPETDLRLDEFDPYSGRIPWPTLRPGKRICRLLKLTSEDQGRIWKIDGKPVMRAWVWGDRHEENNHSRAGNYGERLVGDLDFLLAMLRRTQRDLIIEVQINRDTDRNDEKLDYAFRDYTRLYLLRADGTLHTLYGHRQLRSAVGQ